MDGFCGIINEDFGVIVLEVQFVVGGSDLIWMLNDSFDNYDFFVIEELVEVNGEVEIVVFILVNGMDSYNFLCIIVIIGIIQYCVLGINMMGVVIVSNEVSIFCLENMGFIFIYVYLSLVCDEVQVMVNCRGVVQIELFSLQGCVQCQQDVQFQGVLVWVLLNNFNDGVYFIWVCFVDGEVV